MRAARVQVLDRGRDAAATAVRPRARRCCSQAGTSLTLRPYSLYLVRTRTGALYTGITTDVARRLDEHQRQSGPGAKSLRARGPLTLVYTVAIGGRGLASKTEYAFKRLSKAEKEGLVRTQPCRASLLQHLGIDVAAASPAAADTAGPERE